ncbi:putative bacterial transferase hexapeptide [Erysiphe neolycopersici]|uniref:Putative bacterial transferase hexapeptide n=1 Tax=Erysiphe neolycopersici TaxID=212602 RepID=A0A420I7J0_9PEZI|nr:putative bacterial transferase hexapeptide [Erysiphe neolycopersici]
MEGSDGKKSPNLIVSRFTAVNSIKGQKTSLGSILSPDEHFSGNDSSPRRSEGKSSSHMKLSLNQRIKPPVTQCLNPIENRVTASTNSENFTFRPAEISHKRRRSSSRCSNSYHGAKASASSTGQKSPVSSTGAILAPEEYTRPHINIYSRDKYPTEIQHRQYPTSAESRGQVQEPEAWSCIRQLHPYGSFSSDEQIARVLQRESHNLDAKKSQQEITIRGGKNDQASNFKPEVKKRKRNFSNRTKTGCMTCRRRKKKCDETKPTCNNCLRGGFTCTGYQTHDPSPKQGKKPAALSLQSKTKHESSPSVIVDSYASPSAVGYQQRQPLSGYCSPTLRVDSRDDHILGGEGYEQIPCNYSSSIQQLPSPKIASGSACLGQKFQYVHERTVPDSHLNRQESRIGDDQGTMILTTPSSIPQLLHPPVHGKTEHTSPQIAAQLAVPNIAPASRTYLPDEKIQTERPTQKEKMLTSRLYYPRDKELVQERERCKVACWRFNNSTNPNLGVSPDERARLFRDIVYPRLVGDDLYVEAPFSCDYGYNISIGDNVEIGKNCTILDVCEVKIGNRCHIGPNVDIYTASLPIDPKIRLGANGPQFGKKVTIKDDCWICGRVLILPGLTIGEGSIVGAGSVVTKDVPPYTLVRGSPAHVLRAISRNESKLILSMELDR